MTSAEAAQDPLLRDYMEEIAHGVAEAQARFAELTGHAISLETMLSMCMHAVAHVDANHLAAEKAKPVPNLARVRALTPGHKRPTR